MIYTVYAHVNKVNDKKYIGITNNKERRWRNSGIEYKPSKKENQNRPFWNAIEKYGFDKFEHKILFEGLSFEDACEKEIEKIEKYETTERGKGYNISPGGNGGRVYEVHPRGMLGKEQTDHQKESHRIWASDLENNCMTNGQVVWGDTHDHPQGMLGKSHSEETKEKISEFMTNSHPNFKRCYAVFPDGTRKEFKSPKFLCEYYGLPGGSANRMYVSMKTKPYAIHPASKNKRYDLVGMTVEFD